MPTGCAVDVVAVGLDHLARHRAVQSLESASVVEEARPRLGELELQRVAVERAQALDLAVVVERLLVAQRARSRSSSRPSDAVLARSAV